MSACVPRDDSFFAYGRRRRTSLNGTVPGVKFNKYRGGYEGLPDAGHEFPQAPVDDYLGGHLPDLYDPHPGFMTVVEPHQPDFDDAESLLPRPTPPILFEPEPISELPEPPTSYEQSVRMGEMVADSLSQPYEVPIERDLAPPEPDVSALLEIDQAIWDVRQSHGQSLGLEDIIEHELAGQHTSQERLLDELQPQPAPRDPYDQEMQQFLNPFGMPGPMG